MILKKFVTKICISQFFIFSIFYAKNLDAIIPYFNLPTKSDLKTNSLALGQKAYQLLYFGQLKDSLRLAELAVSINDNDERLWALLAEIQLANNQNDEALSSIKKGKLLNPKMSELYFAESSIYIKQKKRNKAKNSLIQGLKLNPQNNTAIFQLGNIFLIEKNYKEALKKFNEAIEINPLFWQAVNNKGLIYFELGKIKLSIENFEKAIEIETNAEPVLALAAVLQNEDPKRAISLARNALKLDPNYVDKEFRKEQLWGEKLQLATQKLFENQELQKDINSAKLYKN